MVGGFLLITVFAYAGGMLAGRRRGRCWPAGRALCWYAGLVAVAAGVLGPAAAPGFAAHVRGHLLLGMAAPLLLVLAAPGTLLLRALPVRQARRFSRFLATPAMRGLTHPVTAVVLNAGGLWLLYTTGLFPAMMHRAEVHQLVQVHVFVSGLLLAMAVVGVDPMPHRPGRPVRAAALLTSLAAHAILAKYLYGHPPAGVSGPDGRAGALAMYYGGDLVHLAMVAVFWWQWYDPARMRVGERRTPLPWRLPAHLTGHREAGSREDDRLQVEQRGHGDRGTAEIASRLLDQRPGHRIAGIRSGGDPREVGEEIGPGGVECQSSAKLRHANARLTSADGPA
jgi:putative membrane protein